MSSAAQTYARNSQTTASPREIEAQALLKAARQLQDVVENWSGAGSTPQFGDYVQSQVVVDLHDRRHQR